MAAFDLNMAVIVIGRIQNKTATYPKVAETTHYIIRMEFNSVSSLVHEPAAAVVVIVNVYDAMRMNWRL